MRAGFRIERFRGIYHPQQFVDFKTLRNFAHKFFELSSSFREMTRLVLRNRSFELKIELLPLQALRRHRNARQQWERKKPGQPGDWGHSIRMLAPHEEESSRNYHHATPGKTVVEW